MRIKNVNKILKKIKELISYLTKNKTKYLNETSKESIDTKKEFVQSIKNKEKPDNILLQNRYEKYDIQEELSPFQLMDLKELYKKQIEELERQIDIKKQQLN